MSRVYSEADYHGVVDDQYRRYPFFSDRAVRARGVLQAILTSKILIAGCGWGFLIEELTNQGFTDVWGCDASDYAVNTAAPRDIPSLSSRVLLGDVTSDQSMIDVANAAGLPGNNPRFRACITEDILPCAETVEEAQQMLTVLRTRARALFHFITPRDQLGVLQPDGSVVWPWGEQAQMPGFLWLSEQEWIDLIGPGEGIVFAGSGEVVNL